MQRTSLQRRGQERDRKPTTVGRDLALAPDTVQAREALALGTLAVKNDAPVDGVFYGRQNENWANVALVVAPPNAQYLVLVADPNLTLERVFTVSANAFTVTDAGAGAAFTLFLADLDHGDITVSGTGATWTIDSNVVTYAKLQDVSVTQRVLGRNTAGSGDPEGVTLSQLLDWVGSAAQGDILYRGAASWSRLAAGTVGKVLRTGGSGADPSWVYHHLEHNIHGASGADLTWAVMPAAATLFAGSARHVRKLDLSNYTQARLVVTKGATDGFAGSKLILRYHTAFSTTASDYSNIGTSEVSVAVDTGGISSQVSSWTDLASGAKADVWVSVIGSGGNGVVSPTFGTIHAEFR